jgi:hypothetical protein
MTTEELNCWERCSLSSRQKILLRRWLTELTDSEGSDNEMRDNEKDTGQKQSRTVKSEVIREDKSLGNVLYICEVNLGVKSRVHNCMLSQKP